MKIIVLNGSHKVEKSVTMQYVYYMRKLHFEHDFQIINVTRDIEMIKKNVHSFESIINTIRSADLVLWAFPVYGLFVPAEYKKFIELVWECCAVDAFADKYAAALTTSIHFLDNYARYYINAVSDDLNMKYLGEFFAEGNTMLEEGGRKQFEIFISQTLRRISRQEAPLRTYPLIKAEPFSFFAEENASSKINSAKKVVILANDDGGNENLSRMVERFSANFAAKPEIVNLNGLIKHGCIECYKCTKNNRCVFEGKDGFFDAYFNKLRNADIVVFADSIRDRHLSSAFKYFVDRCFAVNHQPRLPGKTVGFIISGPLDQMVTLRHALEAWTEANDGSLAGIEGDWSHDSASIIHQIDGLAQRLLESCEQGYARPKTFEAVGAMKIYRDAVWGELRSVFVSDHEYYKHNGRYDFLQRNLALRLWNIMQSILNIFPAYRKWLIKSVPSIKVKKHENIIKAISNSASQPLEATSIDQ